MRAAPSPCLSVAHVGWRAAASLCLEPRDRSASLAVDLTCAVHPSPSPLPLLVISSEALAVVLTPVVLTPRNYCK